MEDSFFLLVCDNPDILLPTVKSRFLRHDFGNLATMPKLDFWFKTPGERLQVIKDKSSAGANFEREELLALLNALEQDLAKLIDFRPDFANLKVSFEPLALARKWLNWPTASPRLIWEYLSLNLPTLKK